MPAQTFIIVLMALLLTMLPASSMSWGLVTLVLFGIVISGLLNYFMHRNNHR